VAKLINIDLSMPDVNIIKENKKIIITGDNLYLAKERIKTRDLFFDLEIKS